MRDEWTTKYGTAVDSRSSQGLTRVGRQTESNRTGDLDRSASLTLARKGMRLKGKSMGDLSNREVSARRQVGDAESMVNQPDSMGDAPGGSPRWWRNVGMDEAL